MDFRNPDQYLGLLQNLPADAPVERLTVLSNIVGDLLAVRPAPDVYLEILETARPLIDKTRAKLSGLDGGEPLPPDGEHNALLLTVTTLWHALSCSYALLAEQDAGTEILVDQRALLAQRRVYYAGKIVSEYYCAHRALPSGLWREIHGSFIAAEAAGIHAIRVSDPLNAVWKAQSALEAYISILLLDLANAFGRSGQEWKWICHWAERFAPYCSLDPNIEGRKPTTYGLDLTADHGLRPLGMLPKGSSPHYFDCNKLASQIQSVFAQFKQGVSPSSLGLGDDCSVETSARLLLSLYRPWGLASAGRRFPRRGGSGEVGLCANWLSIGFHVQGKLFEQPHSAADKYDADTGKNRREENGNCNLDPRRLEAGRLGLVCERWELLDQSVGGLRLQQRPHAERLAHHQLVGVRPPGSECFLLAQISWLMFREDGLLETGIHLLPGLPQVIAARPHVESDSPREPYSQAFVLGNDALQIPPTLILPEGWYRTNGIIEVLDGGQGRKLRMSQLLLKGPNFEQIGFVELS